MKVLTNVYFLFLGEVFSILIHLFIQGILNICYGPRNILGNGHVRVSKKRKENIMTCTSLLTLIKILIVLLIFVPLRTQFLRLVLKYLL